MQPQQILSSLTSAIFKFTKRFEDVFSDLDNHRKTMSSLEQGITDLQHRTAWMAGSSKQDRLEQLEQEVTVATKGSSLATTRAARRLSYGITPNASGQFLPPKIQHFEETSATLERRIREHERHMQDWMTAMEKRFPVQQAGLVDPAANGHQQPSADVTTDNSSSGHFDAEKVKELLERKFKTVVAQSKNKFEVHEARLTALEKDFYKPVQQTLPVADRLDNLEYDVGNAVGQMKELTVQMSDTANSISLLHKRVDNLRLDMKNLGKKGEASTDHESLQCTKRAIEHLEEQHRGAFTKSKETAERMAGIERAVDQMRRHLLETTSRHDRRLWELDNSSRKAHGDIAAVHRGLNQQILELKASMLETDIDILDRVRFIGILQPQPEQTHAEDAYLAPRIISPDPEWDAVGGTSSSRSPPTPPTYSSFSLQVDDVTVVLLPPIEPSSEIPSNQTHNGPLEDIDTVSSSPFGTISDSVQMDIAERHLALNSNSGATAIASSSADRIVAAEAVVEEDISTSSMTTEEATGGITELSARQPTIRVDGSTKSFAQSLKTWFSIQKNNQDPAAPDPQPAATLASSSSTPTTLRSLNSTSSTWHLTSSTGARMPSKE
ncbi:hypothetical protein QFC21_002988 [Naganishia friedmannii]|uniref:Uncharacterized protein n=1 Tax=Naganishia friedmannii TaxID=89922 RepID=A0ACC2VVX8_9TREE|nr:hypothetical protein QFC21_002988 [Naganishia friedmannii]